MKSLLLLLAMLGTAYADKWPAEGPCDDAESCEKACAKNQRGTCYWGGALVMQTAEEGREARAQKLFERACTKGDAEGCYQVARIVERAEWEELKKSGPKTLAMYKRACGKNHARACFSYASALKEGGDAKSKKLAAAADEKGGKILAQRCLKENMFAACSWGYYAVEAKNEKLANQLRAHQCKLNPDAYDCKK
jgi:TPR repeat protein